MWHLFDDLNGRCTASTANVAQKGGRAETPVFFDDKLNINNALNACFFGRIRVFQMVNNELIACRFAPGELGLFFRALFSILLSQKITENSTVFALAEAIALHRFDRLKLKRHECVTFPIGCAAQFLSVLGDHKIAERAIENLAFRLDQPFIFFVFEAVKIAFTYAAHVGLGVCKRQKGEKREGDKWVSLKVHILKIR